MVSSDIKVGEICWNFYRAYGNRMVLESSVWSCIATGTGSDFNFVFLNHEFFHHCVIHSPDSLGDCWKRNFCRMGGKERF